MNSKKWIIGFNLILFLGYFVYSIKDKEQVLDKGDQILLKLAPVDPRSLIQGDYMRLNYAMNMHLRKKDIHSGYLVISKDENNIGTFLRSQLNRVPLADGEYLIKFRKGKWGSVKIGAESYFFQEGKAERFESAEYGCLRVDGEGNSVLVGLFSKDLEKIE